MYCTQTDLLDRIAEEVLIELTDDEGLGQVNAERVAAAINDACVIIDAYVGARYPIPLDPVPGAIKKIAVDMAIYNLFSRRGFDENSADKAILDRDKAAINFLEHIAKGLVTIGAGPIDLTTDNTAQIVSPGRVFNRNRMRGW